ncbi:hypothetical protein ABG794_02070 [Enterobacter soli]
MERTVPMSVTTGNVDSLHNSRRLASAASAAAMSTEHHREQSEREAQ